MPANLLLEIGCEEIPSRYLASATQQLREISSKLFEEKRIKFSAVRSWSTPRRLVVLLEEVAERQEDLVKKIKGPPVRNAFDKDGAPNAAAAGFARSAGVKIDDLVRETINGSEYLMAHKEIYGEPVMDLLPALMYQIASSIRFPRSMYWQKKGTRFARPVRWLLCLYGHQEVNFDFAGVLSSRHTYGHRFLSRGAVELVDTDEYFRVMADNHVILDKQNRKELILKMLTDNAAELDGRPLYTPELLEEVSQLVEYPEVVRGSFLEEYLSIPREVLVTTMQVHQRFFPVVSRSTGKLMPYFLGISNNRYNDYTRRGYEKVIEARLADAAFFYREDARIRLDEYVPGLEKVVFLEAVGSMYEKTERVKYLTRYIGKRWGISLSDLEMAERAAYLCKADLITNMVKEFPELQGVMGREYAILSGEQEEVATAVYEHYLPGFAGDDLPATVAGLLVSLGDKLDTLAGCFYAGIQPTGSEDPYALRRQALGIVSILLDKEIPVSLPRIIDEAFLRIERNSREKPAEMEKVRQKMGDFIKQRIRYLFLEEKNLSYDIIDAVLAVPYEVVDDLYHRALVLQEARGKKYFEDALALYTRVHNMVRHVSGGGEVHESLFEDPAEARLWQALQKAEARCEKEWAESNYREILSTFGGLREDVDLFFEKVLVMADDESLRQNRLNILVRLKKLFNKYAEFSLIQVS
ncbi:MAG: glycine--tRNA ligase subunit beta [Dethiobacteria bacterium]